MSVVLHHETRKKFNSYKADIARANNVENVNETFAVAPAPTQKIISAYQEAADFLKKINFYQVDNASGQKIGLQVGTSVASTTDTRTQPRKPTAVGSLDLLDEYLCTQTNYDVAYYWNLINTWRHFPEFKQKLQQLVTKTIALDKLCIGWNGVYRAPSSDRIANPMLEDVKKGWLQKIRENAPEQCFPGSNFFGDGKFYNMVGQTTDRFKNLDAFVESAIDTFIPRQHRSSGLVAIVGSGLMSSKYLPILNTYHTYQPTEMIAAKTLYATKELGSLQAMYVPKFPERTILITTPDNLSIYMQNGTLVRSIQVQPEWDRDVDFQSVNEDFVVEDYSKCALLENIHVT
ncbi:phage major capsid protein, P2 family [Acinetobacter gerneri]|uniref:phage major capsid protein, P2 family n=1 Tax=Acinetobacter gerneri TaxID=202952 RepID=UPI003A853B32